MSAKRAGVCKHPEKFVWGIRYYVEGTHHLRWKEIGTRAEAVKAYALLKEKTYRKRRSGAIPRRKLRAGVFKHPTKPVWCACYHVDGRPVWEEIGTRAEALRFLRDRK